MASSFFDTELVQIDQTAILKVWKHSYREDNSKTRLWDSNEEKKMQYISEIAHQEYHKHSPWATLQISCLHFAAASTHLPAPKGSANTRTPLMSLPIA